ncbi:MAG: glycosyltransferase [Candidatus Eisenbacteria bacterium]|nr:glycosyltransferase [Candidatus Eisenbacteria bacterium]
MIEAAAALDWPADRLEIQVLDDSSDETVTIAAATVARLRARGVDVTHVRRGGREGFKAGALAHGLAFARGSLVAVFDADFVPPPEFLRALVPHFADPAVGMAQARWGHLNRGASALTEAQAAMLDAHFRLEHAARAHGGLFLNFNGTAGLWRRACIESAGGWSHDTLTEDLDLSYRAQLAGWRFVYDDALVVPAELPSDMRAFLSQQRRWAKGSIQTARKVLPALFAAPLSARHKWEGALHLTANAAYPLLLALSLALPVVLGAPPVLGPVPVWALQVALLLAGSCPWRRSSHARRPGSARAPRPSRAASPRPWCCARGCASTTRAPCSKDSRARSATGSARRRRGSAARAGAPPRDARFAGRSELALAALFTVAFALAAAHGETRALPFLAVLVAGFAWVGAAALAPALRREATR